MKNTQVVIWVMLFAIVLTLISGCSFKIETDYFGKTGKHDVTSTTGKYVRTLK